MSQLVRRDFNSQLTTTCPSLGSRDVNDICVTFYGHLSREPVLAEEVAATVQDFEFKTIYAEDLACAIADKCQSLYGPCMVVVRQIVGHGVSAWASA